MVLISLPLLIALSLSISYPFFIILTILLLVVFLIALVFFRDPHRKISKGIVSPADGKIIEIGKRNLTVYMGIHNVHVNRSPVTGRVLRIEHIPGKHSPANMGHCENNERMIYEIDTDYGKVTATQIAGILARRTVSYVEKGEHVDKGQRIGMIRFGSRVELELPHGVSITVKKGDLVKAGETTVGVWI